MDLLHTAIWVSDVEQSVDFYEALGLERQWSFELDGVENVYVGNDDGEMQLRYDPDREPPETPDREDFDHIGFGVDDTDEMYETAIEAGATTVLEPTEISKVDLYVAFVEDPDGYVLELIEEV